MNSIIFLINMLVPPYADEPSLIKRTHLWLSQQELINNIQFITIALSCHLIHHFVLNTICYRLNPLKSRHQFVVLIFRYIISNCPYSYILNNLFTGIHHKVIKEVTRYLLKNLKYYFTPVTNISILLVIYANSSRFCSYSPSRV